MNYKDHDWSDLPLPTRPVITGELSPILYSQAYTEATRLLDAVVLSKERKTKRVVALTKAVIELNGSHCGAWQLRAEAVGCGDRGGGEKEERGKEDGEEVQEDLEWLDAMTFRVGKNYQVWHYRQCLLPLCLSSNPAALGTTKDEAGKKDKVMDYLDHEKGIAKKVISGDEKNHHGWAHLIWVMGRTLLMLTPASAKNGIDTSAQTKRLMSAVKEELGFVDGLLHKDVYNNSAWVYRYWLVTTTSRACPNLNLYSSTATEENELEYCLKAIQTAPTNEAAWNYLVGLYDFSLFSSTNSHFDNNVPANGDKNQNSDKKLRINRSELVSVCDRFKHESVYALQTLAYLYSSCAYPSELPASGISPNTASEKKDAEKLKDVVKELEQKVPMRSNYWKYLVLS